MPCIDVVAPVRGFPREVGGKEEGVEGEADGVVHEARGGEGAVATFVGDYPEAGPDETLDETPDSEERVAEEGVWRLGCEGVDLGVCVDEEDGVGEVAEEVEEGPEVGGLEAVCWDGVAEFLNAYLAVDGLEYGQLVTVRRWFNSLLLPQSHLDELPRRYQIQIGQLLQRKASWLQVSNTLTGMVLGCDRSFCVVQDTSCDHTMIAEGCNRVAEKQEA